jgi:deazaflavin-dependent oxidoreductase (nitroreductase family)
MARVGQIPWTLRLANVFTTTLLRAGIKLGNMSLLTVRGRKSGLLRTTPVAVGEYQGQRYLVGTFGGAQWVSNLRAAGRGTLSCGRRSETVSAIELPPADAAILLQYSLKHAPGFVRGNFAVTAESPIADLEHEILRHPVFLVQPLAHGEGNR